jgi:toxin ParE1/3/4
VKIVWLTEAEDHRDAAIEYIALDSLSAALNQLDEIAAQTSRLAEHPMLGRSGRVDGTRELVINRTPFLVIYRLHAENVQILEFLHGSQKWP